MNKATPLFVAGSYKGAYWRRFVAVTRDDAIDGFRAAYGHDPDTLTEARHAVFYANGFKYSERLQAEDRNHRIGQARAVTYIDLHARDTIDDRIAKALAAKGSTLDQFRREVDKVKASHKDQLRALVGKL